MNRKEDIISVHQRYHANTFPASSNDSCESVRTCR
jgi:hypothetical protein